MTRAEMKQGKNRFGVDMQYFHKWFARSLMSLCDYKPDELARELARMSKAADKSVLLEDEFRGEKPKRYTIEEFLKEPVEGLCWVKDQHGSWDYAFFSEIYDFYQPMDCLCFYVGSNPHSANQLGITHVQPIAKPEDADGS